MARCRRRRAASRLDMNRLLALASLRIPSRCTILRNLPMRLSGDSPSLRCTINTTSEALPGVDYPLLGLARRERLLVASIPTRNVAVAAVDGTIAPRLERNLRLLATGSAGDWIHGPLTPRAASTGPVCPSCRATARTALGVGVPPSGEELLVFSSERELLPAVLTGEGSIFERHSMTSSIGTWSMFGHRAPVTRPATRRQNVNPRQPSTGPA
jgi:hypothetical protein